MTDSVAVQHVVQLLTREGSVAKEAALEQGDFEIGRAGAGLACPDDAEMADRHARITVIDAKVVLADSSDGAGVWLRIQGSEGRLLRPRDQVWLGAQVLIMRRNESGWEVRHHGPDGRFLRSYSVPDGGTFIGRASDLVLDAGDSRLSRRHAQLVPEGDDLRLYDRGAHNGTYLKLTTDEALVHTGEFRISANRFRYMDRSRAGPEGFTTDTGIPAAPAARGNADEEATAVMGVEPKSRPATQRDKPRRSLGLGARLRSLGKSFERRVSEPADSDSGREREDRATPAEVNALEDRSSIIDESAARTVVALGEPEPESKLDSGKCLLVLDSDAGSVSLEASPGQTILEAAQEAGLTRGEPVDWECGDGGCGVCVLGVVEGADRLDPPDPATGEMRTIQITEQVVPDPKKYRLACLARVRGTVRLRKLT